MSGVTSVKRSLVCEEKSHDGVKRLKHSREQLSEDCAMLIVQGSGVSYVDGEYILGRNVHHAGCFEKTDHLSGEKRTLTICKQIASNNEYRCLLEWVLSLHIGSGSIMLYVSPDDGSHYPLPSSAWHHCAGLETCAGKLTVSIHKPADCGTNETESSVLDSHSNSTNESFLTIHNPSFQPMADGDAHSDGSIAGHHQLQPSDTFSHQHTTVDESNTPTDEISFAKRLTTIKYLKAVRRKSRGDCNVFNAEKRNHPKSLHGSHMIVTGAGSTAHANGQYEYVGLMNWGGWFEKPALKKFQGQEGRFAIYRCRLVDSYQWFLSFVPLSAERPGGNTDCNLYHSVGSAANVPLPRSPWRCMTNSFRTDLAISVRHVPKVVEAIPVPPPRPVLLEPSVERTQASYATYKWSHNETITTEHSAAYGEGEEEEEPDAPSVEPAETGFEFRRRQVTARALKSMRHNQESSGSFIVNYKMSTHLKFMKEVALYVSGTLVCPANGEYNYIGAMNKAGCYSKPGKHMGKVGRFSIYKCRMLDYAVFGTPFYVWFLSFTPSSVKHIGGKDDVNLYYSSDGGLHNPLPYLPWHCLTKNLHRDRAIKVAFQAPGTVSSAYKGHTFSFYPSIAGVPALDVHEICAGHLLGSGEDSWTEGLSRPNEEVDDDDNDDDNEDGDDDNEEDEDEADGGGTVALLDSEAAEGAASEDDDNGDFRGDCDANSECDRNDEEEEEEVLRRGASDGPEDGLAAKKEAGRTDALSSVASSGEGEDLSLTASTKQRIAPGSSRHCAIELADNNDCDDDVDGDHNKNTEKHTDKYNYWYDDSEVEVCIVPKRTNKQDQRRVITDCSTNLLSGHDDSHKSSSSDDSDDKLCECASHMEANDDENEEVEEGVFEDAKLGGIYENRIVVNKLAVVAQQVAQSALAAAVHTRDPKSVECATAVRLESPASLHSVECADQQEQQLRANHTHESPMTMEINSDLLNSLASLLSEIAPQSHQSLLVRDLRLEVESLVDQLGLDEGMVHRSVEIVYSLLHALQQEERLFRSTSRFLCKRVCEHSADDSYDTACLKVLCGVFPSLAADRVEERLFSALSDIDQLGGGLAGGYAVIPMHCLCGLLLKYTD